MRRREFLTFVGGAFAAWPLRAIAQPATKRPLIAWLAGISQVAAAGHPGAFLAGMKELGYTENRDFDITYRFADGVIERLPKLAEELIQLKPNIIVAAASANAVAVKKLTETIPIVVPAL